MKYIMFTLTMPNNNSWNGKWTGEGNLYCRIRKYSYRKNQSNLDFKLKNVLSTKGCYYNFGDGWGAFVTIKEIPSKDKNKIAKKSKGFCGYDWMIDEIEKYGKILTSDERREERSKQESS